MAEDFVVCVTDVNIIIVLRCKFSIVSRLCNFESKETLVNAWFS